MNNKKVVFKSGASSTKIPRFELIPRIALVALADRYELGLERHGETAWSILSADQSPLDDKEWLTARLAHVIDHATKALDKLHGRIPDDGDDDAAAIMWGGSVLAAARDHQRRK